MRINESQVDYIHRTIYNDKYPMLKKLLVAALFLFPGLMLFSQEAVKPFRVGVSLGCSFAGYREETDAPINRYLNAITYIIDGNIEKGNFFHALNLGFFTGKDQTAEPFRKYHQGYDAYRGYLEYALDYRLWGNAVFPGYLGGALRTDIYYTSAAEFPRFTGLISLNVHASQKWIIDTRNRLVLSAGFPIVGYGIRPPYAGVDELYEKYIAEDSMIHIIELGRVTSLHNYWAFFADLKHHHRISALISFNAGIGCELSRVNFPQARPRIDSLFRINTGISFTF
jgi:hypothetical protein